MTASKHLRAPETESRRFRGPDGMYRAGGGSYVKLRGTRVEVLGGVAYQTTGGLRRAQLGVTRLSSRRRRHGRGRWLTSRLRVVSKRKRAAAERGTG